MNLKPYPEYKDSGIQWIGEIPKGWNNYKLKHVVNEFVAGGTPRSDDEKFWAHDEYGIPWVNIGDMTNKEIVTETKKEITVEGQADKGLRILKNGTLLYSIFASLGKVAVLGIDATTNQAILGLIISKKIDTIFLKYYLKNLEEPIITLSNANTQNNLNSTIVKNIEIAIPSLSDQAALANFLDRKTAKIDALIEKDKKLIALLKEKQTALINHAVTKGLDPNVKLKDSGIQWIGEIPEGWEVRKIKHFSRLFTGSTPDSGNEKYWDGNITWVTPADLSVQQKFIKESKRTISHEGYINSGTNFVNVGAVILATRAPIGYPTIVGTKLCFNQGCKAIEIKRDFIPDYVYYYLNAYVDVLVSRGNVTTFGELSSYGLTSFQVLMSSLSEQIAIANFLDKATAKIDKTIKLIEKKIKLLEEYKKSLIHQVVTGKVDVRGVEA